MTWLHVYELRYWNVALDTAGADKSSMQVAALIVDVGAAPANRLQDITCSGHRGHHDLSCCCA
jgi:hypothetical protein